MMKKIAVLLVLAWMMLPACVLAEVRMTDAHGNEIVEQSNTFFVKPGSYTISGTSSQGVSIEIDEESPKGELKLNLSNVNIEAGNDKALNIIGFSHVEMNGEGQANVLSGGLQLNSSLTYKSENGAQLDVESNDVAIRSFGDIEIDAGDGSVFVDANEYGVFANRGNITITSGRMRLGDLKTGDEKKVTVNGGVIGVTSILSDELEINGGQFYAYAFNGDLRVAEGMIVEPEHGDYEDWEPCASGTYDGRLLAYPSSDIKWKVKFKGERGTLKTEPGKVIHAEPGSYTVSGSANQTIIVLGPGYGELTLVLDNVQLDPRRDARIISPKPNGLMIAGYDRATVRFKGDNELDGYNCVKAECPLTLESDPGAQIRFQSSAGTVCSIQGDLTINDGEYLIYTMWGEGFCAEDGDIVINGGSIYLKSAPDVEAYQGREYGMTTDSSHSVMVNDGKIVINKGTCGIRTKNLELNGGSMYVQGDDTPYDEMSALKVSKIICGKDVVLEQRDNVDEPWEKVTDGNATKHQVRAKGNTAYPGLLENEQDLLDKRIGKPMLQMNKGQNSQNVFVRVEEISTSLEAGEDAICYEVELLDEIGNPVRVKDEAKLYIPYPDGYTVNDRHIEFTIRHIRGLKADGSVDYEEFTTADGSIQRKPYGLQIVIRSLSPFEMLWETKAAMPEAEVLPATGDRSHTELWLMLLMCSSMALWRRRSIN